MPDTTGFCAGDSASLEIKAGFVNSSSITWATPYNIITNTRRIKATKPGKYFVKVISPQFSYPLSDSTYVKIYQRPRPTLRDTFLCKGKSIVLDAKNPGMRYFWNTGEIAQKIKIESAGTYKVKISNASCFSYDSVHVKQIQKPAVVLTNDVTFCMSEENKMIGVKVIPGTKILWSNGAVTPNTPVTKEGTYWVKTENQNCGSQTDTVRVKLKVCDCEMIIPNSFTPNEDNRNDYFFPVLQCDYSYFNITITDRWGNIVFSNNSANARWDGRFKGNLCPEDIYVYRIESTERGTDKKLVRNGHISLFR